MVDFIGFCKDIELYLPKNLNMFFLFFQTSSELI